MEKLRIGFVGVGSMGQMAHLRNYAMLDRCEVVAISEPRSVLREQVAARHGINRSFPDAESMIANVELDGLVASQPFDRHGSIVKPLYRHKLPIFTEKPIASSVEVGEQMVAALSSLHMVGYNKRSDLATAYARAEIQKLKASGELGQMRYARITMPPGDWIQGGFNELIRTGEPSPQMPSDPPSPGMDRAVFDEYVTFVNYYIHQVNLLRYLLGEPYRVEYVDPSRVLMAARSDSGVCATIEMRPYDNTVDWQETALVCFEKGWVSLALLAPLVHNRAGRVRIMRDPGRGETPTIVEPQLPWEHSMKTQARNFLNAVAGDAEPPCGALEALEDLRVARDVVLFGR
jgi:predicted dehydrogenase